METDKIILLKVYIKIYQIQKKILMYKHTKKMIMNHYKVELLLNNNNNNNKYKLNNNHKLILLMIQIN